MYSIIICSDRSTAGIAGLPSRPLKRRRRRRRRGGGCGVGWVGDERRSVLARRGARGGRRASRGGVRPACWPSTSPPSRCSPSPSAAAAGRPTPRCREVEGAGLLAPGRLAAGSGVSPRRGEHASTGRRLRPPRAGSHSARAVGPMPGLLPRCGGSVSRRWSENAAARTVGKVAGDGHR